MLGRDLDLSRLTLSAAQRLVDHDLRVRKRVALTLRTARQKEGSHAGCHADAGRGNVTLDVLHGIVDRHTCGNTAARAVDIKVDVLIRVFRLQEQKLRYYQAGGNFIYLLTQEDDALLQKSRIYVVGSLTTICLFNDIRYQCHDVLPPNVELRPAWAYAVHSILPQKNAFVNSPGLF